jgi:large subunit ribosomal protein L24
MAGLNIRKDDNVRVMSGKDRGKEGRVVRVLPGQGRVMVDGVALAKKHERTQGRRSTSGSQLQQGGIIDVEMFVDASNVQIVCGSCGKPTRVGFRIEDDGSKRRICRRCEAEL